MIIIQAAAVMVISTVFYGAHYCSDTGGNFLLELMLKNSSDVMRKYNRPPRKLPKHHLPCIFCPVL